MKKLILSFYLIVLLVIGIFCNKEVSVSPTELSIHTGQIFIESNPTKAKIYLNGKNTGRVTPDSIRWLEAGTYKLILKIQGWRDSVFNVTVNETNIVKLNIDFTKNPLMFGSIEVKSSPSGAQVFLNYENTGKITPTQIDSVLPGTYTIFLHKEQYLNDTSEVEVESQKITSIFRALGDTAHWVIYNKDNCPLPSNTILNVAIDKNNVKWIGTDGEGLVSYDGVEWKIYNSENSPIPFDKVNVIYVDNDNNKWFGTAGLVKYDGASWTIYNTSNSGLPSDMVWTLESDINGVLWIGTYDKGLVSFDGINWKVYNTGNSGLPSNYITSITIDKKGNKWIGTYINGIAKFDGSTWEVFNSNNMWIPDKVTTLKADNSNNIWAGITSWDYYIGGLYKYDDAHGWALFSSYFSDRISCIVIDPNNIYWIGSYDNGIGLIKGRFVYNDFFNSSNSPIHSDIVNDIAVDIFGHKWIATGSDGLLEYR
jgi:ligand-binding sensor domain-containing protein